MYTIAAPLELTKDAREGKTLGCVAVTDNDGRDFYYTVESVSVVVSNGNTVQSSFSSVAAFVNSSEATLVNSRGDFSEKLPVLFWSQKISFDWCRCPSSTPSVSHSNTVSQKDESVPTVIATTAYCAGTSAAGTGLPWGAAAAVASTLKRKGSCAGLKFAASTIDTI
jgi:hypothetical protein